MATQQEDTVRGEAYSILQWHSAANNKSKGIVRESTFDPRQRIRKIKAELMPGEKFIQSYKQELR